MKIRKQLETLGIEGLVSLHNVLTMSRRCIGGDTTKNRRLLVLTDDLLMSNDVSVVSGRLINKNYSPVY